MGEAIDRVELWIEIELRTGIELEDEVAEKIRTVGDLHAIVFGKVSEAGKSIPPGRCVTAAHFYAVRKLLTEQMGVPRRLVRPEAKLNDLVPPTLRNECVRIADSTFGHCLVLTPSLPAIVVTAFASTGLAFVVFVSLWIAGSLNAMIHSLADRLPFRIAWTFAVLALTICVGISAARNISRLCERRWPRSFSLTVRDLALALARREYRTTLDCPRDRTEEGTWRIVRETVSSVAGISEQDIAKDSRLADLNIC